ncbi:MAG: cytidine deaminase [Patescibacteria group bacterium]|nr:cytidine deaminase [Patescibacteria group bacterium]
MESIKYSDLNEIEQKALAEAEKVMENAYEPIYGFRVGACLISVADELVSGTNYANTAYGSSLCAERAAILRANSMGIRKFKSIATIARNGSDPTSEVTAPCGDCRQVMNEMADLSDTDLKVILSTTNKDKIIVTSIKELLPLAYGPRNLVIDRQKRNEPS